MRSSFEPPGHPWTSIVSSDVSPGYLSFYYSDDLSPVPVRWITKPHDNKSDPNLETLTYGLFSTCSPGMRSGIINRQCSYIFFVTSRNRERCLTGYYDLGWYSLGPLGNRDFAIAARSAYFVKDPIPLKWIDHRMGTRLSSPFRGMRCLDGNTCARLASLIENKPNALPLYLEEIDRLERFNLRHTGYRYIGWRQVEKFSWTYASEYFRHLGKTRNLNKQVNASPTDKWECTQCGTVTTNKALLKRCPKCGTLGELYPKSI